MTIDELKRLVRRCHDQHFGKTELRERLRDLTNEVAELTHYRDQKNLHEEAGDAGWSLLQLCNELGLDFGQLVQATVNKLDARPHGRAHRHLGQPHHQRAPHHGAGDPRAHRRRRGVAVPGG